VDRAVAEDITISGGGSFAVATDEMHRLAQCLELARDLAWQAKRELSRLPAQSHGSETDSSTSELRWAIENATTELTQLETDAAANAFAVRASAEAYGFTDRAIAAVVDGLSGMLGYGIGFLAPILLLNTLRVLALGGGVAYLALAAANGGPEGVPGALKSWLQDNREALNNPATVELIRLTMMSSNEAISGAAKIPYGVSEALEGLGLVGISSSAFLSILAGNSVGLFGETPIAMRQTSTSGGEQPPRGLAERIERLPDPKQNDNGEQLRIDRYSAPGQPDRFDIYIAGTVDFSPVSGEEPFDLTSNFHGMADLPAGSYRGVEKALELAGVTSTSPVVFTGHSQGGLLASSLASSGNYNTQGVVTIGAPTGQIAPGGGFPVIAIEHTEDLIPALGGRRSDLETIVVRRAVLRNASLTGDVFFPAHERTAYAETAKIADTASNNVLREAIEKIDHIGGDSQSTQSTTWLAKRIHP
jgi:hypothetical protein